MPEGYKENVGNMIVSVKDNMKGDILSPYYMEPNCSNMMRGRIRRHGKSIRTVGVKRHNGTAFISNYERKERI